MITTMLLTAIANVGRRVSEWAERRLDTHERHVIDLFREMVRR